MDVLCRVIIFRWFQVVFVETWLRRWTHLGGSAANHPLVSLPRNFCPSWCEHGDPAGNDSLEIFQVAKAQDLPISSLLSYVFSATSWELGTNIYHPALLSRWCSFVPWRLITILSTHNSTVPWRAWRIFDTCSRLKSDVVLQGKTKHTYVSLE